MACSVPADPALPVLKPQFGTADNDFGVDVALGSSGRVYVLSEQEGSYYENGYEAGSLNQALLSRYDSSGTLAWTREVASVICDYTEECVGDTLRAHALVADVNGYSYALVSRRTTDDLSAVRVPFFVYKFDAAGSPVRSVYLGQNGQAFGGTTGVAPSDAADLAADGSGNFYVVRQNADFSEDYNSANLTNIVTKYSPTGSLPWQCPSTVGTPRSIAVSGDGFVYVGGSTGVAKYTNSGNLVWTKAGAATDIAAVGTNTVYARNLTTVRKLDANGQQLWSKAQTGLSGMVIADMTTDGGANIYLTGKYNASSTNRDVFTRKLSASSGSTVFTKTFGTPSYDDARGIATLTDSEVFITGATQGPLAPPYKGGEQDGYVRKLSSSGNPVWTR